jgi:D-apionolactonase
LELIPLVAGPLRMMFDPQRAFLRYVQFDDVEVVRGVYVAVRDKAWNSIPFDVFDLQIDAHHDHFSLGWRARCASDEIAFEWRGAVTGSNRGTVVYQFEGEARKSFLKNRIGICLLHPIRECAGRRCRVEHGDRTTTDTAFPEWISPRQAFINIRSIQHSASPGVEAKVTFEGDEFEMEDQRNWTDASFKTYSTPLDRPYPQRIEAGERIKQSATIELQVIEAASERAAHAIVGRLIRSDLPDDEVRIRVDWNTSRSLPAVGLSMAHFMVAKPNDAVIARLKGTGLSHLRVDLHLSMESWRDRLQDALRLSEQIDVRLELALFCDTTQEPAWRACLEQLAEQRHRIARGLVLPANARATPTELVAASYQELKAFDATIPIAFGTDGNFADLNRNRPTLPANALVCYSLHPQMHASDKISLCETLEGQPATVNSAYEFFQREVVISPITLLPRFNWTAVLSMDPGAYSEPPADYRQSTGFVAAWTVGTLSQLATHPHLASVTFYETFGPRGIMDSLGNPYAVHSVFSAMSGYQRICTAMSSGARDVVGLALIRDDGSRGMIVGNMSLRLRKIVVESGDGSRALVTIEPESVRHASQCEFG